MNDGMNALPGDRFWDAFDGRHAALALAILTAVLFGDVLFSGEGRILSRAGADLFSGEYAGLDFLLRELSQGRLPLWNPHLFGGTPLLATPLYPGFWIGLVLPLPLAVNWILAGHVFLFGFFLYLWTSRRGLHPLACLLAAVLGMCSGPFFMHIYAGHMVNVCAMAWVPLLLLVVDRLTERPATGWVLAGAAASAMQILTGQFQYVYYTALTLVLYGGLRFGFMQRQERMKSGMALLAIPAAAAVLTAFFLVQAYWVAQEGIRSGGTARSFSAMFSFPPENVLTLLSPFLFGDMQMFPYWGRAYLWEMSLFFGVTGFYLALSGIAAATRRERALLAVMVGIPALIALGARTPLFSLLYEGLPGFGSFRGTSKFMLFTVIFLLLSAAMGTDRLLRVKTAPWPLFWTLLAVTAVFGALSSGLNLRSDGPVSDLWAALMGVIRASGESYLPASWFADPAFVTASSRYAGVALAVTAGTCLLLALLLLFAARSRRMTYLVVLLALLEVVAFARLNRPTFTLAETLIPDFARFYREHPGDYRVLSFINPNTALSTGAADIWGYGPLVLGRYAQFMAFTQGADPDRVTSYLPIRRYSPLHEMLRLRYVIMPGQDNKADIKAYDVRQPRFSLAREWRVIPKRNDLFREMASPSFSPTRTVLLEKEPTPRPEGKGAAGSIRVLAAAADEILMDVDLAAPAILVASDNYSQGWCVEARRPGPQSVYAVSPANYTLLAVPLTSGQHRLRLYYSPPGFGAGAAVAVAGWLFLAGLAAREAWGSTCFRGLGRRIFRRWKKTENVL